MGLNQRRRFQRIEHVTDAILNDSIGCDVVSQAGLAKIQHNDIIFFKRDDANIRLRLSELYVL